LAVGVALLTGTARVPRGTRRGETS